VSLFATLLAAFKLSLAQQTGATDLSITSPVANRLGPSVQGLIGKFANTIVTRTRLDLSLTFLELVRLEFQQLKDSLLHQHVPFRSMIREVLPEGDMFPVSFGLQNYPMPVLELAGARLAPLHVNFGTTLRELAFTLVQQGDEIEGVASFNAELLSEDLVRKVHDRWLDALGRGLVEPHATLRHIQPDFLKA
jgi:non-ribosomal peptide synthetase component F